MNILEIKVKKLPESCFHGNCIFPEYYESQITDYWRCIITEQMIKDYKERPEWCPLVVEESPEDRWKRQTLANGNVCVNCDGDGWDRCMELTCEWCKGKGKYVEEE